jgi:hypothetical protein
MTKLEGCFGAGVDPGSERQPDVSVIAGTLDSEHHAVPIQGDRQHPLACIHRTEFGKLYPYWEISTGRLAACSQAAWAARTNVLVDSSVSITSPSGSS